jgi:hypothetical protein
MNVIESHMALALEKIEFAIVTGAFRPSTQCTMLESVFQTFGCKLLAGGALAKPVAPTRRPVHSGGIQQKTPSWTTGLVMLSSLRDTYLVSHYGNSAATPQ